MRPPDDLPDLAEQFRRFGTAAGRDGASLYQRICQGVAEDDEILGLMAGTPADQRRPNLLLAAVHYLLLAGTEDPLASHYPTVAGRPSAGRPSAEWPATPAGARDPFDEFAGFCHRHRDEVVRLLDSRATQTNEVGRCTALLPALATVAGESGQPLSLLDLGASAGLNLLFDRYAYNYTAYDTHDHDRDRDRGRRAGDAGSPVLLQAELREGDLPDLAPPRVAHRAGIDQHPVDPDDEDRSRWLLACQWPDHVERFRRLRDALALARATPGRARVASGDVVRDLPTAVLAAPADTHLCIFHTWVAAYLTPDRQEELAAAITAVSQDRPVSWLFAESPYEVPALPVPPAPAGRTVKGATALVLVDLDRDRRRARRLADMHPHGRWLHWWGDQG